MDASPWAQPIAGEARVTPTLKSARWGCPEKRRSNNPDQATDPCRLVGRFPSRRGLRQRRTRRSLLKPSRLSQGTIEVFPLARSGEDVADWLTQFPAVEKELEIDVHVLLIVDLPDLLTTFEVPVPPPSAADTRASKRSHCGQDSRRL